MGICTSKKNTHVSSNNNVEQRQLLFKVTEELFPPEYKVEKQTEEKVRDEDSHVEETAVDEDNGHRTAPSKTTNNEAEDIIKEEEERFEEKGHDCHDNNEIDAGIKQNDERTISIPEEKHPGHSTVDGFDAETSKQSPDLENRTEVLTEVSVTTNHDSGQHENIEQGEKQIIDEKTETLNNEEDNEMLYHPYHMM